jgi:hypothetical protein
MCNNLSSNTCMKIPRLILNITITTLSFFLFLLTTNSIFQTSANSNQPIMKLKEYKFEKDKVSVFLPDWNNALVENSTVKVQAQNPNGREEINFGYEDTEETLTSYWTATYRNLKELNPENYMSVQDTMLGNLPSKLLYFKGKDSSQLTSCMHNAYWNGKILHYNYLSRTTNCQEPYFTELSKAALILNK